jgi:hypothetical protein
MNSAFIENMIERYYTQKLRTFGPIPQGVDWNGEASQQIRFDQLFRLVEGTQSPFSILDYGCGYGAMLPYLKSRHSECSYMGYDISIEMIKAASDIHRSSDVLWGTNPEELVQHDYVVASGIFNVKESIPDQEWEQYILNKLSHFNSLSKKGFAFNILSDYSDLEKRKSNLYYANPGKLFHYCKTAFSKYVALLHDYPLYEFTILVRKDIQ